MFLNERVKSFFRCLECEGLFESFETISQHYSLCHNKKRKKAHIAVHVDVLPDSFYDIPAAQICKRCTNILETRRLLQQHFNDVHKITIFHCPHCDIFLKSISGLRKHFRYVHSRRVILKNNTYYGYVHMQKPEVDRKQFVGKTVSDRQTCLIEFEEQILQGRKDQSVGEPTAVENHPDYCIEQVLEVEKPTVVQDDPQYHIEQSLDEDEPAVVQDHLQYYIDQLFDADEPTVVQDYPQQYMEQVFDADKPTMVEDHPQYYMEQIFDAGEPTVVQDYPQQYMQQELDADKPTVIQDHTKYYIEQTLDADEGTVVQDYPQYYTEQVGYTDTLTVVQGHPPYYIDMVLNADEPVVVQNHPQYYIEQALDTDEPATVQNDYPEHNMEHVLVADKRTELQDHPPYNIDMVDEPVVLQDHQQYYIEQPLCADEPPTVVQDYPHYYMDGVDDADNPTVVQDQPQYHIDQVPDAARKDDTEIALKPLISNPPKDFRLELSDKPIIRSLLIIPSTTQPINSQIIISDAVAKCERREMATQTKLGNENCKPLIKTSRETQTCLKRHVTSEHNAEPANDSSTDTDQPVVKRKQIECTLDEPDSIIVSDTNIKAVSENNTNIGAVDLNNNLSKKDLPFVRKLSMEEDIGNGYCPNCPLRGMGFFNEDIRKTHRCPVLQVKPKTAYPKRNMSGVE